jgi:hypothetical protein|tara:strand:+ start:903 stop:1109 length:207 start_codon:yes stop_codon:yes gene_type:complete
MQHKISEMCDKVTVMYEKSLNLRRMKYDTPKLQQDRILIDAFVADIQALAGDIFNDKIPHEKLRKENE